MNTILKSVSFILLVVITGMLAMQASAMNPAPLGEAFIVFFIGSHMLASWAPEYRSARLCVNALGTLQALQVIIQRSMNFTFTKFPQLRLFTQGFKELDGRVEQMGLGQTAYTRKLGDSAVGNFGDASSAVTLTNVPMTLSNFPQISHAFTVDELNQSGNVNLLDFIALPVGVKLAQAITSRMAKLVCKANFDVTKNGQASYLSVASGWTRANTILPLQSMANERGIPEGTMVPTINGAAGAPSNRFIILNSSVNQALLADALIVAEFNNAANAEAIKTGRLPMVSGFDFFPYPAMPNTDGNLIGFVGSADALGYVGRAPRTPWDMIPDLPRTALFAVVTEPNTGFSVLIILEGMLGDLSLKFRLVWLDGLGVGNADNLIRLTNGVVSGTSGVVSALTVTNSGYGYRDSSGAYGAPVVTFSGGGGSGLAATAQISTNGAVTGFTISNAGTGYTSPPTVIITPSSGGSVTGPASAVASVSGLN
jgi:hypothetical protein